MAENVNEAMLYLTRKGSVLGVKVALEAGADINYKPGFKQPGNRITSTGTALFNATRDGHVDVVRLLLREGASVVQRFGSLAPLHVAALKGYTEIVDLLVQHGATVDIQDHWDYTPLMYAFEYQEVDTARRLIELGARPDFLKDHGLENPDCSCDKEGLKLLEEATKSKLLRCCNPKCGKPGKRKTLKLCGRCKLTRYCSRECQIQHWSVGHKKCCGHDVYYYDEADRFGNMALSMTDHVRKYGPESLLRSLASLAAHSV
ncbi:uncharacterized protein LOC144877285 [Branchiostoma floridae x Branchiostoma japonicum]